MLLRLSTDQTMKTPTMEDIEVLTKTYADAYGELSRNVAVITEAMDAIKKKALPGIKRAVEKAAQSKVALAEAVAAAPALFEKPRTQIFHGVKVGLQKGKGGIDFQDADAVVARIKRYGFDDPSDYLHVVESPNKEALEKLEAAVLKKLGCEIVAVGDHVVIKLVAGDVEKTVNALLKGAVEEASES